MCVYGAVLVCYVSVRALAMRAANNPYLFAERSLAGLSRQFAIEARVWCQVKCAYVLWLCECVCLSVWLSVFECMPIIACVVDVESSAASSAYTRISNNKNINPNTQIT